MQPADNSLLTIISNSATRCDACGHSFSGFEVAETASTECDGAGQVTTTIKRDYRPAKFAFCPACGKPLSGGAILPLFPSPVEEVSTLADYRSREGRRGTTPGPSSNGHKPRFKDGKLYTVTDAVKIIGETNRWLLTEAYRGKKIPYDAKGTAKYFRGEDLESWWKKQQ